MIFATNRSVMGLMHICVDGEPDVIRRQKYKYLQSYVDRDDWAYNLDVYYNLQYLGDAPHWEVHYPPYDRGGGLHRD